MCKCSRKSQPASAALAFFFCGLAIILSEASASDSASASAAFPRRIYAPNDHLKERLLEDDDRVLPSSDTYSLAVDAEFFKPVPLSSSIKEENYSHHPWHGNGYWIDTRIEIRPVDAVRLNWKLSAYQGSSSGGPVGFGAEILSRAAASLETELGESGWNFVGRLSDLGRQTLGRGLIIEDQETAGFLSGFANGPWRFLFTVDGTGGVWTEGEVFALSSEYREGLIGLMVAQFTEDEGVGQMLQPIGTVVSLYSTSLIGLGNRLAYDLEVGHANGSLAGLVGLRYLKAKGRLLLDIRPQYRRYFSDFAQGAAGETEPVFMAYDQMDDRFTTFQNIFVYGSNASVTSLYARGAVRVGSWVGLTSEHELGRFSYATRDSIGFHFFRSGLQVFPVEDRDDEIFFYVSNKWMNAVVYSPLDGDPSSVSPRTLDQTTRPTFVSALHFGLIARARF